MQTLRVLYNNFPEASQAVRLHVLVQEPADAHDAFWRAGLAEASELLGGVHMRRAAPWPLDHAGGNYMRKMYTALNIAQRLGYSHMLSLDDDVLLPPAALAAMVMFAAQSKSKDELRSDGTFGKQGCAALTPTLSTGVPTTEMWTRRFLSPEKDAKVRACYAKSGEWKDPFSLLNPLPDPWDENEYYNGRLRGHMPELLLRGPNAGGVHPVRMNDTCGNMVHNAALGLLEQEYLREHDYMVHVTRAFPYLCNSVWYATLTK